MPQIKTMGFMYKKRKGHDGCYQKQHLQYYSEFKIFKFHTFKSPYPLKGSFAVTSDSDKVFTIIRFPILRAIITDCNQVCVS